MTSFINWLALFVFALAAILFARWVIHQSFARWTGPKTPVSFAFLYVMVVATIGGLSFVAASVLYYEILFQDAFMQLIGVPGVAKFLLMFSGVWYGMLYAFKIKDKAEGWAKR